MKTTEDLTIGALSARSGVNIETIRYYEKIGVMPSPTRSASGYRIYGPEHVRRLHFVRRGRELGFGLDELRGLLRLVDGHTYTCEEVHALTVEHLTDIRQKIADLRRLERVMSDMAAQCTRDQVPECPIIDALFEMKPVARQMRRPSARTVKGTSPR
ncbi:MAG: helix-turn-helix domain-containing protein [Afipia sp.]|jgi:MerR family mercuric resistance operon transcriptional regulator|uniref:Helix-turn-helix domain-containing protein n=1 Tax=Candidatus Afipia apatlaquensis TaxID=2712852 RepID=A0A7C9VJK5_9BRAD|nr:helix-turn-helix domain-containing protein [Afipia sp.]MBQ8105244.1 helix-turn-helix domain-containing protein [Afipia sp.]NGX95112.1 helix-turn-helix domain-containing protein [Candidatus Afipia apatlaquensis]